MANGQCERDRSRLMALIAVWGCLAATVPSVGGQNPLPQLFGEGAAEEHLLDQVVISRRQEKQIGDAQFAGFRKVMRGKGVRFLRRGTDLEYVRQLVAVLAEQMTHRRRYPRFVVYLARSKTTDARAFPGGTIVVTTGMLDFAESEAALVGVLAHELSHIDRGHQLDRYRRTTVAQQGFTSGRFSLTEMFSRGRVMMTLFTRPFRPEQESEADADATRWTLEAGYDPLEFARLFDRWAMRDGNRPAAAMSFLQSHPPHRERLAAVSRLAADEARRRGVDLGDLYVGRENLTQRIPRHQRRFP